MGENSEQLNKMMGAFQSFGLNIIQSMGEMKSIIERLDKRIESLESSLLKIKSFEVSLQEISMFKHHFDSEIHELKSIMKSSSSKQNIIKDNSHSPPKNKFGNLEKPNEVFLLLEEFVNAGEESRDIIDYIGQAKDRLFVLTGGHIVLFDMQRVIQSLKNGDQPLSAQKPQLFEKLKSWIAMF